MGKKIEPRPMKRWLLLTYLPEIVAVLILVLLATMALALFR